MSALIRYDAACRALAEAKTVFEAREVRDKAEGLRAYARLAKNRDLEIQAVEIRMRAERRIGVLICDQKDTTGLNRGTVLGGTSRVPPGNQPTLAELGIDKKLSARAQKAAKIPDDEFERRVAKWREQMAGLQSRVVKSLFKAVLRPAPRPAPPLPDGKFRVICADPPWGFETWSDNGNDRGAENHYPTMTADQIAALDIGSLAADDSVLFLWVTGPYVAAGLHLPVIEAWGFSVSSLAFVWVKTNGDGETIWQGQGYGTRANAEVCILSRRGSLMRLTKDVPQVIVAPRGPHSEKPDELYERIERLYPGPYVELFARRERPGWVCWGDEVGIGPPPND